MKINQKTVFISVLLSCFLGGGYSLLSKKNVSRDPFYLKSKTLANNHRKKIKKNVSSEIELTLEGIMSMDDHLAATVDLGNESTVVVIGDKIGGYDVRSIGDNKVVLARGKKLKILMLD